MQIQFMGTSCMVPTKDRNHQSIYISTQGLNMLVDCGEGTQRQLKIAGIKPASISRIFITHWHGDHVLGLPGLLQTLNASEIQHKLFIYGPKGTIKSFEHMFSAFLFSINFEHEIIELEGGSLKIKHITVDYQGLEHSMPTLGYSFTEEDRRKIRLKKAKELGIPEGPLLGKIQNNKKIEHNNKVYMPDDLSYVVKGKKLAVVLDTVPCKNAEYIASGADTLICESSYKNEHKEKAIEYRHMTASDAAGIATRSGAKQLIITHFSQRYKEPSEILEEAKSIFPDTIAAYDFMKHKV